MAQNECKEFFAYFSPSPKKIIWSKNKYSCSEELIIPTYSP